MPQDVHRGVREGFDHPGDIRREVVECEPFQRPCTFANASRIGSNGAKPRSGERLSEGVKIADTAAPTGKQYDSIP